MFVYFTILKIAMIALLQGFCHFGGGILACLIIGSVLEYIGAVLLGECENFVVREILFYFPGMLLQIIPIYIVSAQYLALSESEMNFTWRSPSAGRGYCRRRCGSGTPSSVRRGLPSLTALPSLFSSSTQF